jgi:hypothetical protein
MEILLFGYCGGCGRTLGRRGDRNELCQNCRAGRLGQAMARVPSGAETALLTMFDGESARRLRRLRRRVRAWGWG